VSWAHVTSVEELVQSGPVVVHGVALHSHDALPAAPLHVWFVPHVVVLVISRHPFASAVHVSTVVPLAQTGPDVVHCAALLQVHFPEPALPVQISSVGHAVAAPYA
jgi:hypothetical protein